MYIKILKKHTDGRRTFQKGKMLDVTGDFGNQLIEDKKAVEVSEMDFLIYKQKRQQGLSSEDEALSKTDFKKDTKNEK